MWIRVEAWFDFCDEVTGGSNPRRNSIDGRERACG
jgi:hypothetical protein